MNCFSIATGSIPAPISARPNDDIDTAQQNKKRHIAAKLLLRPGMRVLDIGSGWGGLALYLAAECGADVTGLTLSEEQFKVANRRAAAAGLADRVRFHLRDYREESGRYDRIVSVGMFEHVGVNQYPVFFRKLRELLAPDGVALLHSIGRMDGPGATNPWMRKYIFPGGYSPALSEVVPHAERARLWITDIEILRLHYAETLARLARPVRAQPRPHPRPVRRALLPHVGDVSGRLRAGLPPRRPSGVPDAARQGRSMRCR